MIAELLAIATAFTTATQNPPRAPRPFAVGEQAVYGVSYMWASGTGVMEVVGVDTVRGRDAYHFRFVLAGKATGLYSIVDTLNSWVDSASFHTLRFHQDQLEKSRKRVRRFEIFPESRTYIDGIGRAPIPSVAGPLDEIALLYFIRGEKLEVGKTHLFHTYFKPASNPITLRVVKRDTIKVAAGSYPAIVVQPIIKSKDGKGLFSEEAGALVWFSDDSARIILQIKAKMPVVGTLTMQLKSYRARLPVLENRRREQNKNRPQ
jgi:hypothetical protein